VGMVRGGMAVSSAKTGITKNNVNSTINSSLLMYFL